VGGYLLKDSLLENCSLLHNSWRATAGNFFGWDSGNKFMLSRNLTIRGCTSFGNHIGFWLDTDNEGVLIEDCNLSGNLIAGLVSEANQGPLTFRDNIVRGNRWGIVGRESWNVTLEGNKIRDNTDSQIGIYGEENRSMYNHVTGVSTVMKSKDWQINGNFIMGTGMLLTATDPMASPLLSNTDWGLFLDTLSSDRNYWYNPVSGQMLSSVNKTPSNLSRWQAETHHDANSISGPPGYYKADSNQNGHVEMPELTAFLDKWKVNSSNVTIREIIEAMGFWRNGLAY
jgi:parallel beta-helix repeat protein